MIAGFPKANSRGQVSEQDPVAANRTVSRERNAHSSDNGSDLLARETGAEMIMGKTMP